MKEPKIRFKGFQGEWKSCTIKDICEVNPKSTLPSVFEYVDLESVVGTEMVSHRTEKRESAPSRAQRVASKGDIFYQTVRPYQKNNYLFDKDDTNYVFSTGYAQLRTKIYGGYLFTLMQSLSFVDKVLMECTGTSYPAINPTNLSKIKVHIIDNENIQKAIASYFQHLDALIQSTTKKIESLKQVKAASLQSMFPKEGETTPRVRFKGFEGDWENKTLGECLTINNERNQSNVYGINDVLSVSDEVGVVNQIKLLGRSYAGKSVANYRVLKTNQIVYTKSPLKSKPYGIVKVNKGAVGIVSVLYAVYDTSENVYPDYIHYYFEPTHRINNYLLPLINKGAKNTMNISDEMALTGNIWIPSFDEQKKIADYLQALDSQITLQTQLLEKLKQIKSACLDNMFV